jgi:YVTN family beta-propeller protein
MAQKIAIHPTNGRAYVPHLRSNVTNLGPLFDTTIFPVVSVIDIGSNSHLVGERISLVDGANRALNLPMDLAFSVDGARLYVTGFGSGDLAVVDVAGGSIEAHVDVGEGPRGLALARNGRRAYVSNAISNDLAVVSLATGQRVARVPTTVTPLAANVKKGQRLFFSSRSAGVSTLRWMSCGSCHFDGHHDGRTWLLSSGPRNTTSLRGTRDTRPLHWSADRDEVQDFEHTIRDLQGGDGLIQGGLPHAPLGPPNAGQSADLDALAAFVNTLRHGPSPFRKPDGTLTAAARRGKRVFERDDVGCAACHPSPRFTDSAMVTPFVKHDVGTGGRRMEMLGSAFDTPSLRGLWDSAPYLHDGAARTLRDVLTSRNGNDRHGTTSHLGAQEIDDLITYLMSL